MNPKRIIISRTDSIGDVMLTLPMAGWLKKRYPQTEIIALGRNYTLPIWKACKYVDASFSWDEVADIDAGTQLLQRLEADWIVLAFPDEQVTKASKRAGIPHRVATARRSHTFKNVNHRLYYSRKKSDLHESQLNLKMLSPLGLKQMVRLDAIPNLYGFESTERWIAPSAGNKHIVIMHPKSKGSALEWPLKRFHELIMKLDPLRYQVWITGTAHERSLMGDALPWDQGHVSDLTGKLSLSELISAIDQCDALIACSTGPLHIAAALGRLAIGLYTSKRPMHIGRWGPIGEQALALADAVHPEDGQLKIPAQSVLEILESKMEASLK